MLAALLRALTPSRARPQHAFTHAFDEVFGLKDLSIDIIKHHGLTDPLVAKRTLVAAGVTEADAEARWPEVEAAMLRYAEAHTSTAGGGLEVLPGVEALLLALKARGALTALVTGALLGSLSPRTCRAGASRTRPDVRAYTGNLTPIGWAKMRALGLEQHFTQPGFGGFGSDHSDRGHLVRIARERAAARAPGVRVAWHVGDTVRQHAASFVRLPS